MDDRFVLRAPFVPTGDQPKAIDKLCQGLRDGLAEQVLLDRLTEVDLARTGWTLSAGWPWGRVPWLVVTWCSDRGCSRRPRSWAVSVSAWRAAAGRRRVPAPTCLGAVGLVGRERLRPYRRPVRCSEAS